MTKRHGKDALIYFGGQNLSGTANTWSLTPTVSDADVSAFADTWDQGVQGPPGWGFSASGFSDQDGSTLIVDKLFDFLTEGNKPLLVYPIGGGTTKPYFYGVGYLSSSPFSASRKDAYVYQMAVKGAGDLYDLTT